MTLLFLVVSASFNPGFGEFGFYYNQNVRKISKATLGVLDTIDSFASLLGVMVYDRFFKQIEVRRL